MRTQSILEMLNRSLAATEGSSATIARMVLVPLLVVVLLTEFEGSRIAGMPKELVAAAIFGIASLTDWLDGYLARRRRQVTWLGQILDPIADKLLTSAAFISLVQLNLAPAWMVAIIIGREFAITALRSLAGLAGDQEIPDGAKFESFAYLDRFLGLDLARDVGR